MRFSLFDEVYELKNLFENEKEVLLFEIFDHYIDPNDKV